MLGSGLAHSPADGAAFLMRIGSALGLYIRLKAWLWTRLRSGLRQTTLSHAFGTILHKVVRRRAVLELIEEIHEGDPAIREDWSCKWWGLEPLDKGNADWKSGYASAFRLNEDG